MPSTKITSNYYIKRNSREERSEHNNQERMGKFRNFVRSVMENTRSSKSHQQDWKNSFSFPLSPITKQVKGDQSYFLYPHVHQIKRCAVMTTAHVRIPIIEDMKPIKVRIVQHTFFKGQILVGELYINVLQDVGLGMISRSLLLRENEKSIYQNVYAKPVLTYRIDHALDHPAGEYAYLQLIQVDTLVKCMITTPTIQAVIISPYYMDLRTNDGDWDSEKSIMTKRSVSFSDPNMEIENLIRMDDDLVEHHNGSEDDWFLSCHEHTIDFADSPYSLSPCASFEEDMMPSSPSQSYAMFLEERLQCSKSFSNSSLPTFHLMHYEF